jgi:hypothetical protein
LINSFCIGNIERRIFSFDLYDSECLSGGGLFFLKKGFMQQQYLFTVDLFGCSKTRICLFTEGFHTGKNFGLLRTPVKSILLSLYQYHEASRGAAAGHMSSPFRSVTKLLFNGPSFPELRTLDPVTLGNLVFIGNNQ